MTQGKILASGVAFLALLLTCQAAGQSDPRASTAGGLIELDFKNTKNAPDRISLTNFSADRSPLLPQQLTVRRAGNGITEITTNASGIVTWEFRITDRSNVFGFGERFNALNQLHHVILNASRDTFDAKGTNAYKPVPFFMSLRGYGIWLDTYGQALFDINVTAPDAILVRFRDSRFRLLFIEGPSFPQILERFTGMIGRAKLPPYWAFAPWKSRNWHPNMAAVYEDIEKYRKLGLPASVIVLDSPWETNYNTFEINRQQFTEPEAMIRRIHELGFKLCLWLTPFINIQTAVPSEPELVGKIPLGPATNYDEGKNAGYFVKSSDGEVYLHNWWKGRGALLDFTNPAAREWWKRQVRKAIRLGADAFKADDGEGNFIDDAVFSNGESAETLRNRYAVLYDQTLQELVDQDLKGDGVLLMRSGTVGVHNLAFFWAGDNEANFSLENGLPSVVVAGLNAGLSGMPLWTHDLGGYIKSGRTPGDDVLFIRWTEFGAFSPIMQLHSSINLGPWDYGDRALEIFRRFSRLHMSLFPYRYAAAQESARTGMPILRALVLLHQDDQNARQATDEYYFGPDFLVAPIITPGTQRSVYLPEGEWIDYWTGQRLKGPRTIIADAPLEKVPLYVRSGAIIPKIPEDVMTLVSGKTTAQSLDHRRVYELYPGARHGLVDFEGRALEVRSRGAETTLEISGAPARITIVWRFEKPAAVTVAGKPFPLQAQSNGVTVTFSHKGETTLVWH